MTPEFNDLEQQYIILTVSGSQKFEGRFTRQFWLKVFREVTVKMLAGAAIIWRLDWR